MMYSPEFSSSSKGIIRADRDWKEAAISLDLTRNERKMEKVRAGVCRPVETGVVLTIADCKTYIKSRSCRVRDPRVLKRNRFYNAIMLDIRLMNGRDSCD